MDCQNLQERILAGVAMSHAENEHLKSCQSCAEFSQELEVIMSKQLPFEVPQKLDEIILNFARENRPSKKGKSIIPFIAFAIAAMLVVAFSVAYLQNESAHGSSGEEVVGVHVKQVPGSASVTISESQVKRQNDILENLWNDESLDVDLLAVESELFLMSAEVYVE